MSDLIVGTVLKNGKYRIEQVLGRGSFGITYLATTSLQTNAPLGEVALEYRVTIKEFFMSEMNTRSADGSRVEGSSITLVANYKRKFIREAYNLSRLNHENIVKVLEVFEENNTAYYVMEYVDGGSIDELIQRHGYLTTPQTVAIVRQICKALEYMHANRMLHLDLKPKNIMISSSRKVKLIDFGLSKQYTENGQPEDSTTIGLGTPGYAPLEQSQYKQDGSLPVTLDVYALGATMFKMLTGQVPPEAPYLLNEEYLLPNALNMSRVDPFMVEVVCKAMAPMKKNRYQSILEIDNILSRANVDDHVALMSLIIVTTSPVPPPVQEPPVPPVPTPPITPLKGKKNSSLKWIIFIVVFVLVIVALVLFLTQFSNGHPGFIDTKN